MSIDTINSNTLNMLNYSSKQAYEHAYEHSYESDSEYSRISDISSISNISEEFIKTNLSPSSSTDNLSDLCDSTCYCSNNSCRFVRRQRHRQKRQKTQRQNKIYFDEETDLESLTNSSTNTSKVTNNEIGWTSNLTADTPFINYLIEKRINFCQLGASSHIAAFVPVVSGNRSCFIHCGKWKGRYR